MATSDPAIQPADDSTGTVGTTLGPGTAPVGSPTYSFLSGDKQKTPPPRRDPQCARCGNPETTPYRFDPDNTGYDEGDILRIRESAHAPIRALFVGIADVERRPQILNPDKNPRPGVVSQWRAIKLNKDKTMVYLMATYSETHTFARLPPVLQHFCIPVSPHCEINANVTHVHTSPEWPVAHGWVIALPFVSSGEVLGRWGCQRETSTYEPGLSLRVDRQGLNQLREIHEKKWIEWEARRAKHEGYLKARYEEYQVSHRKVSFTMT